MPCIFTVRKRTLDSAAAAEKPAISVSPNLSSNLGDVKNSTDRIRLGKILIKDMNHQNPSLNVLKEHITVYEMCGIEVETPWSHSLDPVRVLDILWCIIRSRV